MFFIEEHITGGTKLTEKQIRLENPHFGKEINCVESKKYQKEGYDFNYLMVIESPDSERGNDKGIARASYLYFPLLKKWALGAN